MAVAVKPLRGDLVLQPRWSDFGQDGCRAWRSVSPTISSRGIGTDGGQDVGGIGTLAATRRSPTRALGTAPGGLPAGAVRRPQLRAGCGTPRARSHRTRGSASGKRRRVFPVNTCPHRLCCLPIRETLHKLEHGDQGQPRGAFRRVVRDWGRGQQRADLCRGCLTCPAGAGIDCPWGRRPGQYERSPEGRAQSVQASRTWLPPSVGEDDPSAALINA
jgi:hypothetical protein